LNSLTNSLAAEQLVWLPEQGIGWYPVTAQPYDENYWLRYRAMDRTPVADALNAARLNWARRWDCVPRESVDVGIGGGRFVREFGCMGTDVNPWAIKWLEYRNCAWSCLSAVDSMFFWDSLEHIHDPTVLLGCVRRMVLVSMPIYKNAEHVLRSKHFRRDEHCWYFTADGLVRFMERFGFALAGWNQMEQPMREDIETFAFVRTNPM